MNWLKLTQDIPKRDPVFLSDGKEVWIGYGQLYLNVKNCHDLYWAPIEMPEPPRDDERKD
jgi:hypothetical protein